MYPRRNSSNSSSRARSVFLRHGGVLRTKDAIHLGVHPETIYRMRDSGELETLGRGLYRLSDLPPLGNPDLVTVGMKVPSGVICLISALAFHELTTQIPHEVYIALPRGAEPPRLDHPPIRAFWLPRELWNSAWKCTSSTMHKYELTAPRRPLPTVLSTATRLAWTPHARR